MKVLPKRLHALLVAALLDGGLRILAQTAAPSGRAPARPASPAMGRLKACLGVAQREGSAKALPLAQELVASYPTYEPGLKLEGSLLEDLGRSAEAERLYERALNLAPKDPDVLYKVGLAHLSAGDYAPAVTLLERGAKETPQDADMLFYLAQAYHLRGDNDAALITIKKAVALQPRDAATLQKYGELLSSSGNNLDAVTRLGEAQHLAPSLPRIEFDLAFASLRNEDLEAAGQFAEKAVQRQPNDPSSLALLAEVDVKLSKWEEAKSVFQRILAIHNDDATALLGLGRAELALKEFQASVDTLQLVLQQAPTTILAHFYLSRAYAGLGKREEAAHEAELHNKLVEQAGSVVPADERSVEEATLIEVRQMLTDGHEPQALRLFRERSKGPNATPGAPYMLVGVSYLYMNRPQDAERCLLKALTIEPKVRDAHTYLGLLAMQRQDLAGAEQQFNAELSQDPNSQLAVGELGEVRYRQGRWAEAVDQFTRSRTVSPALLYMLSDSYFHLGNTKQADLAAELAVDYGKDDKANLQRVTDLLTRNQQADLAQRLLTPAK